MAWNDRSAVNSHLNSLLVFVESPFGAYDAERFDVDRLMNLFELVVVDITPLVKPEYWDLYKSRAIAHPSVRVARSWSDVEAIVQGRTWDVWIDELGVSKTARRVRAALRRAGSARVRIRLGLLPGDFVIQTNTKARLAARRSQLGLLGVLRNLVLFVPRRLVRRIPPPDLVLGSGSYTERDVPTESRIIWAHSFDFEKHLVEKEANNFREAHAAVFLDQNLGYHPDQLHSGIQSPVDVDSYYPALRGTFERIEHIIGSGVTVAIHPKSSFVEFSGYFGNREGVREGAQTVVGGASLVLCHASASLSYAVIWRKPVLFLTSDDLNVSWYRSHIDEMSRLLKRPVLNIDHVQDMSDSQLSEMINSPVDEDGYASYEESFIRSRWSPSGRLWQLFADGVDTYLSTRR